MRVGEDRNLFRFPQPATSDRLRPAFARETQTSLITDR